MQNPDCWRQGKEHVVIDIPVELIPVLKAMAIRLDVSFAEVVSMALEDQVRKRMRLEDSIRKMVAEAFGEELERIESIVDPHASSQNMNKKKELPN